MTSPPLHIAVVHNGELADAPASRVIAGFRGSAVAVYEVREQDPWPDTANFVELDTWRRRQADLEHLWSRHLGSPRSRWATSSGSALYRLRLRTSRAFRESAWRARRIERAVTHKHVAAWSLFLENADRSVNPQLLVLEADAVWTERAVDTVSSLQGDPSRSARYVNLAGGLEHDRIGLTSVPRTASASHPGLIEFARPVTNTSCAYVLNVPMAELLIDHLGAHPQDRVLGIDWLFNAVFLETPSIVCLHAEPPVLGHGSLLGITRSWHPDR